MKYVRNYIVKPLKVKKICYAERVCEMNDLAKYIPSLYMKGGSNEAGNCTVQNQEFTTGEV